MLRRIATTLLAVAMLLPLTAIGASAAGGSGQLTVIHGIPGVTVDVWVNGDALLPGFEPETITDALELAAGTYDVEIMPEGIAPGHGDAILEGSIELGPGANLSAIAHLAEDGAPTLSVFANDDSQIVGDNARLTVRHTAEAPSVDVWANGGVLIEDFTNPDSVTVEVPAGDYAVALSLPDMTDVIFDAGTLPLAAGTHYIVYAFGTFPDTFGLLIQTIGDLEPAKGYGTVSVVHGIPGLTVDVYLNGQLAIEDYEPSTIAGPLVLPAIAYDIAIYAADADPKTDAPAVTGYAELPAGANVSIVAYLSLDSVPLGAAAAAAPAIGVFVNDVSEIADGETRLTVRHLADAPNVDVRAGGAPLFEDVPNGASGTIDVPAGDYPVDLTLPGDSNPVFDAGTLSLAAGTSYTVYAVGTFPDTFELLIQTIDGLGPDGKFGDADGSVHEDTIKALAAAGVVLGKADGSFGTNDPITRGQAASFIARALAYSGGDDAFADDDGSVHEAAINALAAAGIAQGNADGTYGPDDTLTRGQMASLWARALGLAG